MSVEHIWNGTVLTVISDSGASSADLKGQKGDTGPRGPQGPCGVILNEQGQVVVDLAPYYTGEEVDNKIAAALESADLTGYPTEAEMATYVSSALGPYATKEDVENVEVDLTGYATETYVKTEIIKAQLEGAGIDTSGFATKDDLAALEGNTTVDLTNYYTKKETEVLVESFIRAGRTDLTAGESSLASGTLYFVFE